MTQLAFAEALQAFVDASVEGGGWSKPLALAQDAMGARGVILQGFETFAGKSSAVIEASPGVPHESIDAYQRDFINIDVRAEGRNAAAPGSPIFDEMLGELGALDRTPIYAELYRPYDMGRFVGVRLGSQTLTTGTERNLFVTVVRPNDADGPDFKLNADTIALAHVVRGALRSAAAFSALRAENDAKSAALDQAHFGWVLLGEGARIVHLNRAAKAILQRADGLECRRGRLMALDTAMQAAIERVCRHGQDALATPQIMPVRRPDGAKSYGVMLCAIRRNIGAWLGAGDHIAAAVFIIDPDGARPNADAIWRSLFGFSQAEADVARLMAEGYSQEEIAVMRGVARATVHTQFKRIYEKIDARSQAGAAARLLRAAPFGG